MSSPPAGRLSTDDQLELLGRYARTVTLLYDADSAGARATMRGIDLAVGHGFDVRVAELPAGEDPDVFLRSHGVEAFRELLKRALSFLEFKAQTFHDQGMLETAEGKTRAVRSIVETLARMPDELKRNFYIQVLAEKYRIYESVLFRELEHRLAQDRQRKSDRSAAGSAGSGRGRAFRRRRGLRLRYSRSPGAGTRPPHCGAEWRVRRWRILSSRI